MQNKWKEWCQIIGIFVKTNTAKIPFDNWLSETWWVYTLKYALQVWKFVDWPFIVFVIEVKEYLKWQLSQ